MKPILPSAQPAEQVVLGSALMGATELSGDLLAELRPDDFYDPGHARIWAAMAAVHSDGMRIDMVTVSHAMRASGELSHLGARGGEAYLVELAGGAMVDGIQHHVRLVKEASTLRRIIFLCDKYRGAASDADMQPGQVLAGLQRDAAELADLGMVNPLKHIKPLLRDAIGAFERRTENKSAIMGVPSGISDLDSKTGGFRSADLIVIAARPSMGKTAFVVGNILHAAENRHPALLFSIEMSAELITERIISNDGRINSVSLQNGYLTGSDWSRIFLSTSRVSVMPIYIDDAGRQTLATIESKARKWRRDTTQFPTGDELGIIAIDYLQLIKTPELRGGGDQKRHLAIGDITKGLKALAKELRVPIVILSQLNRSLESRTDKRPMMSDLAESGSIEQDADLIIFLYRDEKYNPNTDDKGIAEIVVAKQRNGPTGTVKAKFFDHETRFANLSMRDS